MGNTGSTTETSKESMKMTPVEIQQQYYEMMGEFDWELYKKKDWMYLLQKIAMALFGPPTEEGNLELEKNEIKLQGYKPKIEETVMKIFKKISKQAEYSHDGERVLISVLRIVCVTPLEEVASFKIPPSDYWENLHSKTNDELNIFIFHVFCLKKCRSLNSTHSTCKLYIDHNGRVYQNWQSYLDENNLPECMMVVPKDGVYKGDLPQDSLVPLVRLDVVPSPALGLGARALKVADTANIVAGVGGVFSLIGAATIPVIAPAALGTAVAVGITTGIYGIVRSSLQLADRSKHEEDIDLTNAEARGCWINILVSATGLSFGAAGKMLSWAAVTGTNVEIVMNAFTILKYTNLATSTVGMINSLGEMIYKYHKYEEPPTSVEIFQFTTSVLFFGMGVMSNQTAQDIVKNSEPKGFNNFRKLISDSKGNIFDTMMKDMRRFQSTMTEKTNEIIKCLHKIENTDDFFTTIDKLIKNDGKNTFQPSSKDFNLFTFDMGCLRPEDLLTIGKFLIQLSQVDKEYIAELLSDTSKHLHDVFFLVCVEVIASFLPDEIHLLFPNPVNIHDFKILVIKFILQYLKSKIKENNGSDISFTSVLKEFVRDGRIKAETILQLKKYILERLFTKNNNEDIINLFDDIYEFRKTNSKKIRNVLSDRKIKLPHLTITVKEATIEKLEKWLQNFSQEKCNLFMELCFNIISKLSAKEAEYLNLLNPDEDVLMRVAHFLLKKTELHVLMDNYSNNEETDDMVFEIKYFLIDWRERQQIRKSVTCKICKGVYFQNE